MLCYGTIALFIIYILTWKGVLLPFHLRNFRVNSRSRLLVREFLPSLLLHIRCRLNGVKCHLRKGRHCSVCCLQRSPQNDFSETAFRK